MIIQAEVSLYPLGEEDLSPRIEQFVGALEWSGLQVKTGAMSSIVTGECGDVFKALGEAYDNDSAKGPSVLSLKISNACPVD